MSKTQLQTNNAKLSALITELQGKAVGGGSGGGTLETCTLQISDAAQIFAVAYTTVDSGGNVAHAYVIQSSITQTITCLCNSTVAISHYTSMAPSIRCDGCELLYCAGVRDTLGHSFIGLTCGAGETATFVTSWSSGGAD